MAEPVRQGRSATRSRRTRASSTAVPPGLLGLQATAGNAAVTALVQRKLRVGAADDPLEREADTVARRVVADLQRGGPRGDAAAPMVTSAPSGVSRRHACDTGCSHGAGAVGAEGGSVPGDVARTIQRSRGGGRPLPDGLQRRMSDSFGTDLSSVRVHTTPTSDAANQSLGSQAFTTGSDIHFAAGSYDPGSRSGQELLAHELTHVVQQRGATTVRRKLRARDNAARSDDYVLTHWRKFSSVAGKPRSTELKLIDSAVKSYLLNRAAKADDHIRQLYDLRLIDLAIDAFDDSKTEESRRAGAMGRLQRIVTARRAAAEQTLLATVPTAVADPENHHKQSQVLASKSMDPALSRFAAREVSASLFGTNKVAADSLAYAVTMRDGHGRLTAAGMDQFERLGAESAQDYRTKAGPGGMTVPDIAPGVTAAHVRANKQHDIDVGLGNSITGTTIRPEYDNLAEDIDHGGPRIAEVTQQYGRHTIVHDTTDVHGDQRVTSVKQALDLVMGRGVAIQDLTFYLPKYGRKMIVKSTAAGCSTDNGFGLADAIFQAPHTITMSSANTNNPKTDMDGDARKFLSTSLGPASSAMVRSFVHEIGHAAHLHASRELYWDLSFGVFSGIDPKSEDTYKSIVKKKVSSYASNNPREMVAEVFLATMYGKRIPSLVWEMYRSFGGPVIPGVSSSG